MRKINNRKLKLMMLLKKCVSCGSYTVSDVHCGAATRTAHPPPFSQEDKYGKYRRLAKMKK